MECISIIYWNAVVRSRSGTNDQVNITAETSADVAGVFVCSNASSVASSDNGCSRDGFETGEKTTVWTIPNWAVEDDKLELFTMAPVRQLHSLATREKSKTPSNES